MTERERERLRGRGNERSIGRLVRKYEEKRARWQKRNDENGDW